MSQIFAMTPLNDVTMAVVGAKEKQAFVLINSSSRDVKWSIPTSSAPEYPFPSPIHTENAWIAASGREVLSVNEQTGTPNWRLTGNSNVEHLSVTNEGRIAVLANQKLGIIEARSGVEVGAIGLKKTCQIVGYSSVGDVVVFFPDSLGGALVAAISPQGKARWSVTDNSLQQVAVFPGNYMCIRTNGIISGYSLDNLKTPSWWRPVKEREDFQVTESAILAREDGDLVGIDAESGVTKWRESLADDFASITVVGDWFYVLSRAGNIQAGHILHPSLREVFTASTGTEVSQDTLLVSCSNTEYALRDGALLE
jgi:outer membrane protein assembly factor BamB